MKKKILLIVLALIVTFIPTMTLAQWRLTGLNIYNTTTAGGNTLNTSGSVGIGVNTGFLQKLHIKGGIYIADGVIQKGGSTSITSTKDLGLYSLDPNFYIRHVTNQGAHRFFSDGGANPVGGSYLFSIEPNGNIGVNTSNLPNGPTEKLHIDKGVLKISSGNQYGGPMILFSGDPSKTYVGDWGIEYVPTGKAGLNFWKPSGSPNWGNNYLFLSDNNGNIGVRTDNPTSALTVNGNMLIGDPNFVDVTTPGTNYKLYVQTGILTEKVKIAVVNSSFWADYVFKKDYKLRAIPDLELFIEKEKHLPNIPSADDVVREGIDVANMDAKLLEKIEELSLYIIQLHKRIESLEDKIEKIEHKDK